jgi:carbamoyl-phosphate synthase large subunit
MTVQDGYIESIPLPRRNLPNVLVSSAARKIPLVKSVIDAARRVRSDMRVFGGDVDATALSQFVADGFVCLPRTERTNLDRIQALLIENGIGIVIPTRDGELQFWSDYAPTFRKMGIEVVVSLPRAIAVSVDKLRFAEHCEAIGLPTIPAWSQPRGNGLFVVKERFGAGSRSVGLNLDREAAIAHAKFLADPIFQPFIRGIEISVDSWLDQAHHVKGVVMRTRDSVVNGESTVTTTFRDSQLETVCRTLLESLPLKGPTVLQFIRDVEGHAHIIELNARFGGASTASIAAGLDIWLWSLLEAEGMNTDNYPFNRIQGEVRQIRAPSDLYFYDSNL